MRLDKWLWCARFFKARSQAAEAADSGKVRINGARATKAGHGVKIGDILSFARGRRVIVVQIVAFAERRGPADVAATLYREIPEAAPPGGEPDRGGASERDQDDGAPA